MLRVTVRAAVSIVRARDVAETSAVAHQSDDGIIQPFHTHGDDGKAGRIAEPRLVHIFLPFTGLRVLFGIEDYFGISGSALWRPSQVKWENGNCRHGAVKALVMIAECIDPWSLSGSCQDCCWRKTIYKTHSRKSHCLLCLGSSLRPQRREKLVPCRAVKAGTTV
ncbi:hypothetical protein BaRGS_00009199 [Batillaria attramentaria]|uniref:Secreted protein n=1 Tax=Batillaria attramentaria TaxID=370345 RepID=A0ABD0LJ39_9CAEN